MVSFQENIQTPIYQSISSLNIFLKLSSVMITILFIYFRIDRDGIPPKQFKTVIGKGHPEFSTMRQQDGII